MKKSLCVILILCLIIAGLPGCSQYGSPSSDYTSSSETLPETALETASETGGDVSVGGLNYTHSADIEYARNFSIDYFEGGYELLTTTDAEYLIVPEDKEVPEGAGEGRIIIKRPVKNVYLVASAVMDMVAGIGALDSVRFSGKKQEDWYIKEAADAMADGKLVYAGKYSKPDYEMIVSGDCSLVIENTMIFHSPEVTDRFDEFGIPVIVEYSNYEDHPLGRVEWVKFFGALFEREEEAEKIYEEQKSIVEHLEGEEKTDRKVAFFFITSNNLVQVRTSNDFIPKMIDIAGGTYVFDDLSAENENKSTVNMQIEEFYNSAKDADIIIYNSSIDGGVETTDELLAKCVLLGDFKAVKEGQAYCTTNDVYQQSLSAGFLIEDFHTVIAGEDNELHYLFKLE